MVVMGLLLLILGVIIFLPLIEILQKSFYAHAGSFVFLDNFIAYLREPRALSLIYNSLFISCVVTIIIVPIAFIFAYVVTVVALVLPFIICANVLVALGIMLVAALMIIAIFNYYYSVAKSESFKKRFMEMALLSFGVASISFFIGYLLKKFTGIEV